MGTPLFCNRCGRSYSVRLCPRLHPNPRNAEVCSQCGNRELSTPQPKVSFWWHVLAFLIRALIGLLLALLSLFVLITILVELLRRTEVQEWLVVIGILLGVLWFLWTRLPDWLREMIRRSLRKKEDPNGR
ncbi:MAG TPA: zinc ribbon domain-containing protein [Candidatus Sulfotelmatobacter sp.]